MPHDSAEAHTHHTHERTCTHTHDSMDGVLAGWDGPVPTVICEACDSMRTSWLTRLLSEEHEGFTRRQLLGLLNRHKSYTACRQIIRIMQTEPRAISDEEAVVILSRENAAKNGAETPATPPLLPPPPLVGAERG